MKDKKIRDITMTGMGIALFVVFSMMLRVPVFDNYYLCLGYIAMAVYLYNFGIYQGTIVGTVGVIIYCLLISGLRGMPGWTVGNIVIGIILGIVFKLTTKLQTSNKKILAVIIEVLAIIISTAIGILIMKSLVEMILYSQPMIVRIAKNMTAFISDVVVLLISLPICKIIAKYVIKK